MFLLCSFFTHVFSDKYVFQLQIGINFSVIKDRDVIPEINLWRLSYVNSN